MKDSFLKDVVCHELLKNAVKQSSIYDFEIYIERSNEIEMHNEKYRILPVLLLVNDYKIRSLPGDIIVHDTNTAFFEKAFQIK